jgi:hypothetical protein
MEFILIIIVVIVIFVISASVKKKPQSSQKPDEPPRPTMSDIQRAFMMASGSFEETADEQPSATRSTPEPADAPTTQGQALGGRYDEGHSLEGRYDEGYSLEGRSMPVLGHMLSNAPSAFADVSIGTYFMDEENTEASEKTAAARRRTQAVRLTLFDNQRDVVKAVIYSEILPRKGRRARS